MCCNRNTPLSRSLLQLFPQLEDSMIRTLKESLEHYEQLKLMEDMLKEDNTVRPSSLQATAAVEADGFSEVMAID